jgi:hypothetical protein
VPCRSRETQICVMCPTSGATRLARQSPFKRPVGSSESRDPG